MLEYIIQVFQNYRLATGLWQTDVWVKDKRNLDVALRLLHPRVRSCLLNFDHKLRNICNQGIFENWTENAQCLRMQQFDNSRKD